VSDDINSIREQLWSKMRNKEYRQTFVDAHLSTNIAAQIQTLREDRGWMQKDLAEHADMSRARISIMESPDYDKFSLSTLRRLAKTFDVALIVRFARYSELTNWVSQLSPEKLSVPSYDDDSIDAQVVPRATEVPASPKLASSDAQQMHEENRPELSLLNVLGDSSFSRRVNTGARQRDLNQTQNSNLSGVARGVRILEGMTA